MFVVKDKKFAVEGYKVAFEPTSIGQGDGSFTPTPTPVRAAVSGKDCVRSPLAFTMIGCKFGSAVATGGGTITAGCRRTREGEPYLIEGDTGVCNGTSPGSPTQAPGPCSCKVTIVKSGQAAAPPAQPAKKKAAPAKTAKKAKTFPVSFVELLYPGDKDRPLKDQWVYAFRGGAVVAEVHVLPTRKYQALKNPKISVPAPRRKKLLAQQPEKAAVKLEAGPPAAPFEYHFVLSPIQLTSKGLNELQQRFIRIAQKLETDSPPGLVFGEDGNLSLADWTQPDDLVTFQGAPVMRLMRALGQTQVALPNLFQWVADLKEMEYLPGLEEVERFLNDERRAAEWFVASVLMGWIRRDEKTARKVRKLLQEGQPDAWLKAYAEEKFKAEKRSREAMDAISNIVLWNPLHKAIERSGQESDGQALSYVYQYYETVCFRTLETAQGHLMLAQLSQDDSRFPSTHIFTDSPKVKEYFETTRFAYLAAKAAFTDALPWYLARHKTKAPERVRAWLKNYVRDKGELKGAYKHIAMRLDQNKRLAAGLKGKRRARIRQVYKDLVKKSLDTLPDDKPLRRKAAEWVEKPSFLRAKNLFTGGAGLFELANFYLAIDELASKGDLESWGGLVGAAGDLTNFVLIDLMQLLGKQMTNRILRYGGVAGVVGGAMDAILFAQKGFKALRKGDEDQAVGWGVAAVGGAVTAIGGGMLIAKAVTGGAAVGSAAGGVGALPGAIIGFVGAVIVIGGVALAAWFTDDVYEEFAKNCFLGNKIKKHEVHWSHLPLGTRDPLTDMKVLIQLLSTFQVQSTQGTGPKGFSSVTVTPGYAEETSRLHIVLRKDAPYPTVPFEVWPVRNLGDPLVPLEAYIRTAKDGTGLEADQPYISRSPDGTETWVITGRFDRAYIQYDVFGDGQLCVPPPAGKHEQYVYVKIDDDTTSLDEDSYTTTLDGK